MNRRTNKSRPASVSRFETRTSLGIFIWWVHGQQELVRIGVTAAIGTVLAWITYEIIYYVNWFEPKATTSWTMAFVIGVFRQHHLHRTLSFPQIDVSYGTSLKRDALASILVATAGTLLNYVLTERIGLHHRQAWGACLVGVATLEYVFLKTFVFRGRRSKGTGQ